MPNCVEISVEGGKSLARSLFLRDNPAIEVGGPRGPRGNGVASATYDDVDRTITLTFENGESFTTDPLILQHVANISEQQVVNWNDAYSWGDHAAAGYEQLTNKGAAGGYVPLDNTAKIDVSFLPDSVLGNVRFKGTYNGAADLISSDDPTLNGQPLPAAGVANAGFYFIVTAAFSLLGIDYAVGDWLISTGAAWQKVDNSDAVTSVFGRIGNIVAAATDYADFYLRHDTNAQGLTDTQKANARANLGFSFTAPIYYNSTTGVVNMTAASTTDAGYVTTTAQSFSGAKTFAESVTIQKANNVSLTIDGTVNGAYSGILIRSNGNNWYISQQNNVNSGALLIGTSGYTGTPKFTITVTGNVGVGITGPKTALQVGAAGNIFSSLTGSHFHVGRNVWADGSNYRRTLALNAAQFIYFAESGAIEFYAASDAGNTVDSIMTIGRRFSITPSGAVTYQTQSTLDASFTIRSGRTTSINVLYGTFNFSDGSDVISAGFQYGALSVSDNTYLRTRNRSGGVLVNHLRLEGDALHLGYSGSKISYFGGAAVGRQAAIVDAVSGTEITTINAILSVLRTFNQIET